MSDTMPIWTVETAQHVIADKDVRMRHWTGAQFTMTRDTAYKLALQLLRPSEHWRECYVD